MNMSEEELKRHALELLGDLSVDAAAGTSSLDIDMTFKEMQEEGALSHEPYDTTDATDLADRLWDKHILKDTQQPRPKPLSDKPLSEPDKLTVERQAELIEPEIRALRKQYFGTEKVPLGLAPKETNEITLNVVLDLETVLKQLGDDWDAFVRDPNKIVGKPITIKAVTDSHSKPGTDLMREADALAEKIGWEHRAMWRYLLTDELTMPDRVTYTIFTKEKRGLPHLRFDIRARNLSREEIGNIYRAMKQELRLFKKKAPDTKDNALIKILKQKGGQVTYEEIQREWEKVTGLDLPEANFRSRVRRLAKRYEIQDLIPKKRRPKKKRRVSKNGKRV